MQRRKEPVTAARDRGNGRFVPIEIGAAPTMAGQGVPTLRRDGTGRDRGLGLAPARVPGRTGRFPPVIPTV